MPPSPLPLAVPLEGYPFLAKLQEWAAGGSGRDWTIYPAPAVLARPALVCCRLTWPGGEGAYRINKIAATIEEAVWLCLEEWGRTPTCGRRPV